MRKLRRQTVEILVNGETHDSEHRNGLYKAWTRMRATLCPLFPGFALQCKPPWIHGEECLEIIDKLIGLMEDTLENKRYDGFQAKIQNPRKLAAWLSARAEAFLQVEPTDVHPLEMVTNEAAKWSGTWGERQDDASTVCPSSDGEGNAVSTDGEFEEPSVARQATVRWSDGCRRATAGLRRVGNFDKAF